MNIRHTTVPPGQLDAVIRALYATAEQMDWEHLPLQDRSAQYARWISEPTVGGVRTRYMTSEQARSWIKDGPMKEFARTRRGTGRYAQYGATAGTTPSQIVHMALGNRWTVVQGTVGVKPAHCQAQLDTTPTFVTWGPSTNFRHLVWAAVRAAVDNDQPAIVVVTETPEHPTPASEVTWHTRIAERCQLEIAHVRERFTPTPDQGSSP